MRKTLLLLSALLLSATAVHAAQVPPVVTIHNNYGGMIVEDGFLQNRMAWKEAGTQVRISGVCASACTVYTGLENACLMPDAEILFHQATMPIGTYIVRSLMAPGFVEYIDSDENPLPTYDSGEMLVIYAANAIELGYMKECK